MSHMMDEPNPVWSPETREEGPRDLKILTVAAWVVIVAVVSGMVWMREDNADRKKASGPLDRGRLIMQELLGRYIIGAREFLRISGQGGNEVEQLLASFPTSDTAEELCLAVLDGEIRGPQQALDRLSSIETETDEESRLRELLLSLYGGYAKGDPHGLSLTKEDRDYLREKLGWFGELALSPPPPPLNPDRLAAAVGGPAALKLGERVNEGRRDEVMRLALQTLLALLSGLGTICFLGPIGLIGLIVLIVFAFKGKVRDGLGEPVNYGGIYAETFAGWLVLFGGLSTVFPLVFPNLDLLEGTGLGMTFSLAALLWPWLRGVSWSKIREDIGLTSGPRPGAEPFFGFVCYVLALPLVALGLLLIVFIGGLQGGMGMLAANDLPSHPIIEYLVSDDPWIRFKVVFLACVIAPVVEEIMFRGVFYRHLREVTRGFGRGWSFTASAFLVSFIFAVIHPQGWLAVPLLMGIAIGLTLGREWRGTLIPSMIGHGINNGLVLAMVINALGN